MTKMVTATDLKIYRLTLSSSRKLQYDPARDFAFGEAFEHIIDGRQRLQFDISGYLAAGGEIQRFGHIFAVADERAADGDAVGDNIEKRKRKFAGRQANQHAGAVLARHLDTLFECRQ